MSRWDSDADNWKGWKNGKYDNRYGGTKHYKKYRNPYKKKQAKKIGIGISLVVIIGIVGFLFSNGVFEINEKNLNESIQNIQETTETAKKAVTETADTIVPETTKKVITETSDKIQEATSGITKKLEEDQIQREKEQKITDEKFLQDIASQIHVLINEERTTRGLSPLIWNPIIAKASINHSMDMANREYFQHDSPEGHDFTWRYSQVGFTCTITQGSWIYGGGENIMYLEGYYDVDTIATQSVDGWMKSSGHRENILTPYFKSEGIGVAKSDSEIYITQNFC
jgi:uncharacterized protein YkwD